jgi:hypothetical protein
MEFIAASAGVWEIEPPWKALVILPLFFAFVFLIVAMVINMLLRYRLHTDARKIEALSQEEMRQLYAIWNQWRALHRLLPWSIELEKLMNTSRTLTATGGPKKEQREKVATVKGSSPGRGKP